MSIHSATRGGLFAWFSSHRSFCSQGSGNRLLDGFFLFRVFCVFRGVCAHWNQWIHGKHGIRPDKKSSTL